MVLSPQRATGHTEGNYFHCLISGVSNEVELTSLQPIHFINLTFTNSFLKTACDGTPALSFINSMNSMANMTQRESGKGNSARTTHQPRIIGLHEDVFLLETLMMD